MGGGGAGSSINHGGGGGGFINQSCVGVWVSTGVACTAACIHASTLDTVQWHSGGFFNRADRAYLRRYLKTRTFKQRHFKTSNQKPVFGIQECRNLHDVGRSTGIRQAFRSSFFTTYDLMYYLYTFQAVFGMFLPVAFCHQDSCGS
jgi:hypothetical protein